jgi:hypothetical protein
MARHGAARRGMAGQGTAWHGTARLGRARRGLQWSRKGAAMFKNYAIEAAWSQIVKHLERFNRGDEIAFQWISEMGKIPNALSVEARLKTHFRKRFITVVRRVDRWLLLRDDEQLEHADSRIEHQRRDAARAFRENQGIDRDKLNETGKQRADHQQRYLATRLSTGAEYGREKKTLLGIPEPMPQLKAVKP